MSYVESGQSNPRTLVLLSGWAQDDRLFKNLSPILAKDFHVVCPNYRGHDAEQTLHGDFTAADLVERRRGVHQIHWRWCGDNALADRERAPSTRDSTIAVLPLVRGRGSRRAYLGRKGFFYGDNVAQRKYPYEANEMMLMAAQSPCQTCPRCTS